MSHAVPHKAKPAWIVLGKWVGFFFGVIIGPTLGVWFIGCVLYPMLIALIPIEPLGLTYENYKVFLARSVRAQQKEVEFYGWGRTERAYDVSDGQISTWSLGLLDYKKHTPQPGTITGNQSVKKSDADSFWGSIEGIVASLTRYCQEEWLPINRAYLLIVFLRLQLWAVPFLMVVLLFIGCFFAGEYTSRERFEQNTSPSSGRTNFWLRFFVVGGLTVLNLPGVPLPLPLLWVLMPMALVTLYAAYRARCWSIEFI